MRGSVGFLVGIIGLCLFASIALLVPATMRHTTEAVVLLLVLVSVAFVFLNITIVGLYRMLAHLHEAVIYPEDPYYHRQRGRALYFAGYIGLLVTLVFVVMIAMLPEITGMRRDTRITEFLLIVTWFMGWICFGVFLGGVLAMLMDLFQKAFYRGATQARDERTDYGPTDAPAPVPYSTDATRRRPWDDD